jgi:hypothetical protein
VRQIRRSRVLAGAVTGLVLAALVLAGPAVPAVRANGIRAQATGGAELSPDAVRATARDLGAGRFPNVGLPTRRPAPESPFVWESIATGWTCAALTGPVPPELAGHVLSVRLLPLTGSAFLGVPVQLDQILGAPDGAIAIDDPALLPAGVEGLGELVFDVLSARAGGGALLLARECRNPASPGPPAPPTAADVWEEVPLPRAVVHASPPGTRVWPGITGLESHFWGDEPAPATAAVEIRGFAVIATARPIGYGWGWPDGTWAAADPGRPEAPVRVTFRRRGDPSVRLSVVWEGAALVGIPGGGGAFGAMDLGTVTLSVSVPYHVAEVRALLRSSRIDLDDEETRAQPR